MASIIRSTPAIKAQNQSAPGGGQPPKKPDLKGKAPADKPNKVEKKKKKTRQRRTCFFCGRRGHRDVNCPRPHVFKLVRQLPQEPEEAGPSNPTTTSGRNQANTAAGDQNSQGQR